MTLASGLRKSIDAIRGIPDQLGIRPFTVQIVTITWGGARVGIGSATVTRATIAVNAGKNRPAFRQLATQDIIASGGLYASGDWKLGPVTPDYLGGGQTPRSLDPDVAAQPTEVLYVVTGGAFPSGGQVFERVGDTTDSALHAYVVLRSTARAVP